MACTQGEVKPSKSAFLTSYAPLRYTPLWTPPMADQNFKLTLHPVITQCCMEALYKLGRSHQSTIDLAKTLERRRCNHREAIDPNECLKDVIGKLPHPS